MHLIQRALPRTLVHAKPCCSSLGPCRTLLRPGRGTATRVGGGQRSAPPRRLMPTELQAQHRLRQRGRFRRQAQGRLPLRLLQGAVFRQAKGGAPAGVPPSVQLQSTSCPAGMCLLDAAAKAFSAASISANPWPLSESACPAAMSALCCCWDTPSNRLLNKSPGWFRHFLPGRHMSASYCCCGTHSIRLCTTPQAGSATSFTAGTCPPDAVPEALPAAGFTTNPPVGAE